MLGQNVQDGQLSLCIDHPPLWPDVYSTPALFMSGMQLCPGHLASWRVCPGHDHWQTSMEEPLHGPSAPAKHLLSLQRCEEEVWSHGK